ncbi:TrmB family transcriptional regulator [Halogeometricum borinquense]|uniref:TrmB family transcriptional regulator n=1 Tax=Halogeometricum borinquense TaxID=60847 RepID=A0A6C0UHV9_9EURY|nr:TrmB family transcriptional regulator [Halogeometricum borinquense]QIB73871.1 TrmB family transcriptional regulator [Halogeometricum borinquense]QIQ76767.1 TrmB family transcriptional regulator [Halogeometricum borinquense]
MDLAELQDALEDAGLSQYQAEAYNALLQLGAASATELADACAVPTARIYDVLRDLETKGYIETYEQDSLRARACDPETVLEDLRSRATMLEAAADEIEDRWEAPEVDRHMLSIVKRFETVFQRAASIIREAENEVQLSVTADQYEELKPALREAFENGAIVKVSLHTDPERDGPSFDSMDFEGVVTEVRHRTLPTPFVLLVDRTQTCFAPHAHSLNEYGVLVDDYTLTYVFHWYFQTCLWEVLDPVYSARDDEPPVVYADVRRCVRDIEPMLSEDATVRATVTGLDTGTGDHVELTGEITEVYYSGMTDTTAEADSTPALSQLAGQVCFTLRAGEETYTVGGWGAVLEDVEATRVTVTKLDL